MSENENFFKKTIDNIIKCIDKSKEMTEEVLLITLNGDALENNRCFSTLNNYKPVPIETAHICVEFADSSVKEWIIKDRKFEQYSGALLLVIKPNKKKVLKGQVKDKNKNAKFSFVNKEDEENVADEVVRIYGFFVDSDYLCVFDFNWTDNKYIYEKHVKDKKGFHVFDIFNLVSNKNNNLI